MVNHITKSEFDQTFIKINDKINNPKNNSILIFSAPAWCGPCKMMIPVLEKITSDELPVYEVDVDSEFELSSMFNIRSVPTIYFVPKEGDSKIHMGAIPQAQMEKLIEKYFG
jgi:thioredoxin-like negative regulator of GroEL